MKNYWRIVIENGYVSSGESYAQFVDHVHDCTRRGWRFTVSWHERKEDAWSGDRPRTRQAGELDPRLD